jgi:hypothetical protein
VIFETPAVPATATIPGRPNTSGTARYVLRVFDGGEEIPRIYDYAERVNVWLASLRSGQPLRSSPPSSLLGPMERAVVPRRLLEELPGDSWLAGEWEFVPAAKPGGNR